MKKRLISLLLACGMTLSTVSALAAAEQIVIDGEVVAIPEELGQIREVDQRTMVPVRFLAEYLGHTVTYSDSNMVNGVAVESATITTSTGTTYLIMHNSTQMYVLPGPNETKGGPIAMDTPSFIDSEEDRFYVPVRFLAPAMGYTVDWDEEAKTVSLTKTE